MCSENPVPPRRRSGKNPSRFLIDSRLPASRTYFAREYLAARSGYHVSTYFRLGENRLGSDLIPPRLALLLSHKSSVNRCRPISHAPTRYARYVALPSRRASRDVQKNRINNRKKLSVRAMRRSCRAGRAPRRGLIDGRAHGWTLA